MELLMPLLRGHLPAKCLRPIVLNVISSNVPLPQHWSMLSQHNLQVDLFPRPDLITAPGRQLHSSDWYDRPLNSTRTSFRGHLILDRKTKTSNTFHFNGNEMPGLYVKAVTFAYRSFTFYCINSICSNLYGPLLILVRVQETNCTLNTFCGWNLKLCFSFQL